MAPPLLVLPSQKSKLRISGVAPCRGDSPPNDVCALHTSSELRTQKQVEKDVSYKLRLLVRFRRDNNHKELEYMQKNSACLVSEMAVWEHALSVFHETCS